MEQLVIAVYLQAQYQQHYSTWITRRWVVENPAIWGPYLTLRNALRAV